MVFDLCGVCPLLRAKELRFAGVSGHAGILDWPLARLERAKWQVQMEDPGRDWQLDGNWS